MRLIDLEPGIYQYESKDAGIYFWCPCPKCINKEIRVRLSCKWIVLDVAKQMHIFLDLFGEGHVNIVPCKEDCCWNFSSKEFNNLTVTPSLDASASGHWHGFITNGTIQ